MYIVFEPTTSCNSNCVFCPRDIMKRKGGQMSDGLFHKIIKEGKEMNVGYFYPQFMGEFFLHPKAYEWLDYMEKERVRVRIFTNAEFIDVDRLIKYKNISCFTCGINAATKETHDKVMRKPDFDKVVDNTKNLIAKAPFKVRASLVITKENYSEIDSFKKIWGKDAVVKDCANWLGAVKPYIEHKEMSKRCRRVSGSLPIFWDGRVPLCCQDYEGKIIFGDANKEHLKDIFKRRNPIRKRHRKLDYSMIPCRDCNFNTINK